MEFETILDQTIDGRGQVFSVSDSHEFSCLEALPTDYASGVRFRAVIEQVT